ncbi:MAG: carboxypeptidase-like regulatory domain-containing protein [Gemmatimonadaceae bacterium]|nr:carboxypeptidase-like regulatory domain-containing protein [Chitinophagaceae bacterium]
MKRIILFTLIFFLFASVKTQAQFAQLKDSVVQLYGVVMTADSLQGIPAVSVVVKGQNRGTITNDQGVFSIVVLKGDKVEFSSVGYKPKLVEVPLNLEGNQFSMIQLLVTDTVYLPATIIRPRPTREQFERDFVNTKVEDDAYEIARKNNDEATRRALMRALPADGREAGNYALKKNAQKYYYAGQSPPIGLLNPFAWGEFINAWKRGDFKNKK